MPTCPNCGATVAATDEFCGNCGTYLAWLKPEPEPAEAAAVTPVEPVPAASPSEPEPEQPHAVAPASPVRQRRPRAAPPVAESTPDGPQCTVCGTVNPPGAKFCRRCGNSLAEAAPAARVTSRWWRRLRLPRWVWGSGGSAWPRRVVVLLVLAVLVVAGVLLYPLAGNLVQDGLDKLATPKEITPSQVTGSAAVPGHPVAAAVDGVTNQYWGAPAVGDSAQFTFAQSFRLLGVVITPGASTDPTVFSQEARPTAVDLVLTTSSGDTTTLSIAVADKPGPQTTDTGVSDVTTIRLVVHAATPVAPGQNIALGEIEFFKR